MCVLTYGPSWLDGWLFFKNYFNFVFLLLKVVFLVKL